MKVFVTGGTGVVGSACITSLARRGDQYDVRGLARSSTSASRLSSLGATPVEGDTTDVALLEREATAADAVIYCAFDHASTDWGSEAQVETKALTAICKALSTSSSDGSKILMYCSGVTGFPPLPELATEDTPLNKMSYRAPSDEIVEAYSTSPPEGNGIRGIQIRLAMVTHVSTKPHGFLRMLHKGDHITYYKDGSNKWAAADAADVGDLVALVLDHQEKIQKGKVSAIHAYTENVSTKDVAQAMSKDSGLEIKPFGDEELGKMERLQQRILTASPSVSNTWTRETYGWQPKGKTLLERIQETRYFSTTA